MSDTSPEALAYEIGLTARHAMGITGGRHQGVTELGRRILARLAALQAAGGSPIREEVARALLFARDSDGSDPDDTDDDESWEYFKNVKATPDSQSGHAFLLDRAAIWRQADAMLALRAAHPSPEPVVSDEGVERAYDAYCAIQFGAHVQKYAQMRPEDQQRTSLAMRAALTAVSQPEPGGGR